MNLKITDIFILQISKLIYKCINSDITCNFNQWYKLNCEVHLNTTGTNYDSLLVNYVFLLAEQLIMASN